MLQWQKFQLLWVLCALASGCADQLPASLADYAERCVKMNQSPLPQRADDPHEGEKNVYACNVTSEAQMNNTRPFADGTVIVKESTRRDSSYPWLVATAQKRNGSWDWNEYSRNFEDEAFVGIAATEEVCIDCHRAVQANDWIYTRFAAPAVED